MKITILGSGDAFGTGGRLQTAMHLASGDEQILIDCGATAQLALARAEIDPNRISTIVLSHLHGDHFAGVVWFVMHAHYVSQRRTPLTIVGPRGTRERLAIASEVLFPGAASRHYAFEINYLEHVETAALEVSGITISSFRVSHSSGAVPYALRLSHNNRVFAFSGDTAWTPTLLEASHEADLFVCECYGYEGETPGHVSWDVLKKHLPEITAKCILLTHMGPAMLANLEHIQAPRVGFSEDGAVFEI